jgi:putative tricarboxylic transport membrane protein
MSEDINAPGEYTVSYRSVDAVVALLFMALSIVVMWDSWSIGAAWASDGPQAGYFPFYIGLIMFIASLGTLVQSVITKTPNLNTFVGKSQLKMVLAVLVPTAVYVAAIPFLGLYVAGAIFIAFFMVAIGKYNILKAIPVAVAVPVALFILFEIWFLIPLPKGPVEAALGF